eukprot:5337107-Prymnesium_polylepis.1
MFLPAFRREAALGSLLASLMKSGRAFASHQLTTLGFPNPWATSAIKMGSLPMVTSRVMNRVRSLTAKLAMPTVTVAAGNALATACARSLKEAALGLATCSDIDAIPGALCRLTTSALNVMRWLRFHQKKVPRNS